MTTITISTGDGRTITSSDALELRQAAGRWTAEDGYPGGIGHDLEQLANLHYALLMGALQAAGDTAARLHLNFAFAPGNTTITTIDPATAPQVKEQYLVPIDPADITNCEACQ